MTVQGPVQLLSRGASLIACSAARDSLAAITDALAPPAHPAIASLDGVESFSSTKAVRSDMRAGMLGSLSGKLSSRRLPRESTGDASRASCFPFTSASRSVVRTSGADSTWPGAGLGTPLAWIDRSLDGGYHALQDSRTLHKSTLCHLLFACTHEAMTASWPFLYSATEGDSSVL